MSFGIAGWTVKLYRRHKNQNSKGGFKMNKEAYFISVSILCCFIAGCGQSDGRRVVLMEPDAAVSQVADGFRFTEGPASDKEGNLFFTDIPNNRIHKWSTDGTLSVFLEDSGGANGLYFDKDGNLIACAGGKGQIVSISPEGEVTVLAGDYEGKPFNSPNDLWIRPDGGVYFTDPRYGNRDNLPQDGEHVYFLSADRKRLIRVIDDMERPNGVIGTPDGKQLYVADHGADQTYVYTIQKDGTLTDKKPFAAQGSDGVTMDKHGNIYLTKEAVTIYAPDGRVLQTIEVPERPSNVTFGGSDKKTLFITARTSLYSLPMQVTGN